MALAVLVTVASLILSALDYSRKVQASRRQQQEVLLVAEMAVQTGQSDLIVNGLAISVERTARQIRVFHKGEEVICVQRK